MSRNPDLPTKGRNNTADSAWVPSCLRRLPKQITSSLESEPLGRFSVPPVDDTVDHYSVNVELLNIINQGEPLDCSGAHMRDLTVLKGWLKENDLLDKNKDGTPYSGTTIMARAGVVAGWCEYKHHSMIFKNHIWKEGQVIYIVVDEVPEDDMVGREVENHLTSNKQLKKTLSVYDVCLISIDESCRLIISKEIDCKYDFSSVSMKCRYRKGLDRIRLNSRLRKQLIMALLANEKQNLIAIRSETPVIKTVLYWEDVTWLDTLGFYERTKKLLIQFCKWLCEKEFGTESAKGQLVYNNTTIYLNDNTGRQNIFEKPPASSPPKVDEPEHRDDPLYTIVCDRDRKVPVNLSVYNAHIISMDTFKTIDNSLKVTVEKPLSTDSIYIPLTKVLFLTDEKTFLSLNARNEESSTWRYYDEHNLGMEIPKEFPIEFQHYGF